MPISPIELANMRFEKTINKLCNLIDKKLQEDNKDDFFEFQFNRGTSQEVKQGILDIYRLAGWTVNITHDEANPAGLLTLSDSKSNIATDNFIFDAKLEDKNYIINAALESEEGLVALSVAMKEPIINDFLNSILTKVLFYDPTQQSVHGLPLYETDANHKSICYYNDSVKEFPGTCPKTEFSALGTIHTSKNNFNAIDKIKNTMSISAIKQAKQVLFKLLNASIIDKNQIIHTYGETVIRAISDSVAQLESKELIAEKILLNPKTFRKILHKSRTDDYDYIDEACNRELLLSKISGHIHSADIHCDPEIEEDIIFILPNGRYLGPLDFKSEDANVLPCKSNPNSPNEISFITHIQCIMAIIYPEYVQKIEIRW